ncbi:diacylglycerol/lipid kinase family protein [Streptomyces odontomachi]|uniref:diacylglycerol/lipid kinase family protein n=1 Tax=Streptomyces odontomachi TaxID=2944940 RepID=UPI00210F09E3|nr:diacylglycerol kinase family protein [Streptomyces sp. ODS25]
MKWSPGLSGRTARRAALRALGSLAIAAAVTRALVTTPQTGRAQPTGAAGRAAAAAAVTLGAALEAPRLGLLLGPLTTTVAALRIRAGGRHRGEVAAGIAIGAGAATLTCRWWPVKPAAAAAAAPPRTPAPALRDGAGLHLVINPSSGVSFGTQSTADQLRALLPEAELTVPEAGDDLTEVLDAAARRAAEQTGALGICGGDGTVNAATEVCIRHGVPLAVFPGGTFNHFAADLGNQSLADVARAVREGDAVTADVGRATAAGGTEQLFLNTFSLGVYTDLVRARERLERRIGKWPALAAGLATVLATGSPVRIAVNGRSRRLWLLFAGNGIYHPAGFAPTYRTQLDDGLLDVRVVDGGTAFARTRLLLAVLTGTLPNSRVLTTAQVRRLRLEVLEGDPRFAYDGEVTSASDTRLVLDKLPRAVTLYRPADQAPWLR